MLRYAEYISDWTTVVDRPTNSAITGSASSVTKNIFPETAFLLHAPKFSQRLFL